MDAFCHVCDFQLSHTSQTARCIRHPLENDYPLQFVDIPLARGRLARDHCGMSEELHELHEHVEAGHHDRGLAPVSITMATLAVLVAVVSLLGHRAHTEELLSQNKASDAWAEYQAQSIRFHSYQQFLDQLSITDLKDSRLAGKLRTKYAAGVEHYRNRRSESSATARQFENEVKLATRGANRFDLGEVCLEAALVITSMTLLTRKRVYWAFGSALAVAGLIITGTAFLIR
jgi:hypothetical protein